MRYRHLRHAIVLTVLALALALVSKPVLAAEFPLGTSLLELPTVLLGGAECPDGKWVTARILGTEDKYLFVDLETGWAVVASMDPGTTEGWVLTFDPREPAKGWKTVIVFDDRDMQGRPLCGYIGGALKQVGLVPKTEV